MSAIETIRIIKRHVEPTALPYAGMRVVETEQIRLTHAERTLTNAQRHALKEQNRIGAREHSQNTPMQSGVMNAGQEIRIGKNLNGQNR